MARRFAVLVSLLALLGAFAVAPAAATPANSPQATLFTEISCENGIVAGEFYVVGNGEAGHILELGVVGVAKSFYLLDVDGNVLFEFFDNPGKGHEKNTTWCVWELETDDGLLNFGADILFQGRHR